MTANDSASDSETETETTRCAECWSTIDAETLHDGVRGPLGPVCGRCLDAIVAAGEAEYLAALEEYATDPENFSEKVAERGPNATLDDYDISDTAREDLGDIKERADGRN